MSFGVLSMGAPESPVIDFHVPSTPRQDVQPPFTDGLLATPVYPAQGTMIFRPWPIRDDGTRVPMDDYCGSGWRLACFGLRRNADM